MPRTSNFTGNICDVVAGFESLSSCRSNNRTARAPSSRLGVLMVLVAWYGVWKWKRGTAFHSRWYLRAWIWMMPSGFIALVAGWWVAEVGRQPWVVYGLLRTADAVSPVPAGAVLTSLIVYVVVYVALFGFVGWYLLKMLRVGPIEAPQRKRVQTAARPLSLGDEEMGDRP